VIRERVRFVGRVQGVGFRYTCASIANRLGITGWVRNDPDGAVTAELQGTPDAIDALIAELPTQRFIRIENLQRHAIPVRTSETEFRVTG